MGVIDTALQKAMRLMIYPVLLIAILAIITLLHVTLSPKLDLEMLRMFLIMSVIALLTIFGLWELGVAPLRRLSRVINILKCSGYRIDDSRYIVVNGNTTIIEVTDCSQIPKNATYTVAAISRRGGIEMFVGIMDEQRRVYRLLNVSIDTCRGY
jgi:hypothetical protein